MLNKYKKKTEFLNDPKEDKDFLIKKYGFYDIEAQFTSTNLIEEKIVKVVPICQPVHEDIIREVDEGPPDSSINDLYENEEEEGIDYDCSRKPFGTMSKYKSPYANNQTDVKKIMDPNNDNPIKVQTESKKVSISGMQGLKKVSPTELKAMFKINKVLEDLDDFTETFFNQTPLSPFLAEQDTGKTKIGKNSPRGASNLISSSLLEEIEESNNQFCSKELTPHYNEPVTRQCFDPDRSPFEGVYDQPFKSITGNFERGSPWVTEEERKKQLDFIKHTSTVKEENANITVTAPSTSLGDVASRFHKIKTPQQKNIEEENNKKTEIIEPTARGDDQEEIVPPKQDKLDANNDNALSKTPEVMPVEIFEEKFILKMGEILTESSLDVKPKKAISLYIPEMLIGKAQVKPPYKIKVIIIPTEWPLELNVEEFEEQTNGTQSFNNENKNESMSTHISKDDKDSVSVMSKTSRNSSRKSTKRRPKSKKTKQKNVGGASSKLSSVQKKKIQANPSQPSVDGSRMNGSRYNGDAASAVGSIATTTKKEEKIELQANNQVQNNVQLQNVANKVSTQDIVQSKPEIPWSGQEVLVNSDPNAAVWITTQMTNSRIWAYGSKGYLAKLRWIVRQFVGSAICENFMNLLVIANTVTLAMDRYGQPVSEANTMDTLNYVFTSIFTLELSLKLFGLGIVRYLSDSLNYLDLMVVIFSWVEIIFLGGNGAVSAFRTLRVLRLVRTVRVIRIARLLRGLQSMMTLMDVISKTIGSFGYIGLMLLIIMLIYALFGMALFKGKWQFPDGLIRPNYENFNNAFIAMFQVLTQENWPTLLYAALRDGFQPLVALYFVSFTFIGNHILLNLFVAIMLDAFVDISTQQDAIDDDTVI